MQQAQQRQDRREWAIAILIAVLTVLLLFLPYGMGYWFARPGTQFTGVIMNAEDSQSYFAKMLQGYEGNWLYAIPYTTEAHRPAFVGGFYISLGHLARGFGITIPTMWHVARVLAGLVLFLTIFGFIRALLPKREEFWTAYLLALYGSGLGWLLFLFKQTNWLGAFPVDFKMPEAHVFFAALTFPHVAFGMALIVAHMWWLLLLFRRSPSEGVSWRSGIVGGVVHLILVVTYPFLIYLILLTDVIYYLFPTFRAKRILWAKTIELGISYLVPAPLILYYISVLSSNDVFRAWDAQSVTLSPHPLHYLVAYGILIVLAFLAAKRSGTGVLWIWILATALLIYAPLNPQRRFVEGVHIPLSILATCGLFDVVLPHIRQTKWFQSAANRPAYSASGMQRLIIITFLGFMSLSNLYIITSVATTTSIERIYPFFRTTAEIKAVEWLHANTIRSDVILSSYETGNYIAAQAGNRVVIGHWAETLGFDQKQTQVKRFFASPSFSDWHQSLLEQYDVAYLFWGERETQAGQFDPRLVEHLEVAYENETVTIYRVLP